MALIRCALLVSLIFLAGCASSGGARFNNSPAGPITVYAMVEDARRAAVTALDERRLAGGKIVEHLPNGGLAVQGELTGLAGAVFNSHGGTGRVTISVPYPGGRKLSVTAITRSRLAAESPGATDAIKGYNYSDPKYAVEILDRIKEILSKGDIAKLRAEDETARLAYEAEEAARLAEEKKKADELAAQRAREAAELAALMDEAARGSVVRCTNDAECRKAFALAQIYVSTKSDMKIQLATDTIIETYNPTETYRLGAKVIKTPGAGQSAEIVLTVACKDCNAGNHESMKKLSLMLMRDFRPFIDSRLRQ